MKKVSVDKMKIDLKQIMHGKLQYTNTFRTNISDVGIQNNFFMKFKRKFIFRNLDNPNWQRRNSSKPINKKKK